MKRISRQVVVVGAALLSCWVQVAIAESSLSSGPAAANHNQGIVTSESFSQNSTIRGGDESPPLSYYGAFLEHVSVCGGALIHGDIALTAAHCVDDNAGFPGSLRFNSQNKYSGGTTVKVRGGKIHPDWDSTYIPGGHDLAVLYLQEFLPLQSASLNTDVNIPSSGDQFKVAGFGQISSGNPSSTILLSTKVPYVADCSIFGVEHNPAVHICADATVTATCAGDSGSPVMLEDSFLQVGINSYSNGYCDDQTVDVYTRISYFADWILDEICANSAQPPPECFGDVTPEPTKAPTVSPTTATPTTLAPSTVDLPDDTAEPSTKAPTIVAGPIPQPTPWPTKKPTSLPTTPVPVTRSPTATPTTISPTTSSPSLRPSRAPTPPTLYPTTAPDDGGLFEGCIFVTEMKGIVQSFINYWRGDNGNGNGDGDE